MKTNLYYLIVSLIALSGCRIDYLSDTKSTIEKYNNYQRNPVSEPLVDKKVKLKNCLAFFSIRRQNTEMQKNRETIHKFSDSLIAKINQKIETCLPNYNDQSTQSLKYNYAIRKIEVEHNILNRLEPAYQLYFFPQKNHDDVFQIYFQSDAFFKKDIFLVLNDMKIIESQWHQRNQNYEYNTTLSYFTGICYYDLDETGDHLQLNLGTPENILGDRKVFRVNCCQNSDSDICDILPDNNTIAIKTHEYRMYNPDKILSTNPYTLYYRSHSQLERWAMDCTPKYDKKKFQDSLNALSTSANPCVCKGALKYRVVFNHTVELFKTQTGFNKYKFSLFFDRNGDLYPVFKKNNIECQDICDYYASVKSYYENSTGKPFEDFEREQIDYLQQQINLEITKIKNQNKEPKLTFLMVGFNNTGEQANGKLDSLIEKITKTDPENEHIFVKILWDGTQIDQNKDKEQKLIIANNFRYANGTSYEVGEKLRKVIKGVNCKDVYFISHSLGANIVCQSMFNQLSKVPGRLQQETRQFYEDNDTVGAEYAIPVNKNFHAALIAPAIPGLNTFVDLLDIDTAINKMTSKNSYDFIVGYNTEDLTLKKEFLPGLKKELGEKFSSTTLGYDKSENQKLASTFSKLNSKRLTFESYNFSDNTILNEHDLLLYMKNNTYDAILRRLYAK